MNTALGMFVAVGFLNEAIVLAAGAVVFFLVLRAIPGFGFPLHRQALRLLLVAVLSFSVTQVLAGAEVIFAPDDLAAAASVLMSLAGIAAVVFVGLAVMALRRSEREEISRLRRAADVDELTALSNRAFFRRAARRRIALSEEYGIPLACVLMDIDDFKPYNDEFGHEAGDRALSCVARALRELARADDLPARYGGEEFVLLMDGSAGEAAAVAERVRSRIERACRPESNASLLRQITVSLGVASLSGGMDLEALLDTADREMYRAKRAGKNRVSVAEAS